MDGLGSYGKVLKQIIINWVDHHIVTAWLKSMKWINKTVCLCYHIHLGSIFSFFTTLHLYRYVVTDFSRQTQLGPVCCTVINFFKMMNT